MAFRFIKLPVLKSILLLGLILAGPIFAQELAPDFEGTTIDGKSSLRLSDFRGRVVFLDFWASWCPPCLLSLTAYDQMRREINSDQFEIIAINVDEQTDDGILFLQEHPVSFSVLADPQGDIGIPYGLRSLPVSYLLDREGRIVNRYRSYKPGDEELIKQEILELLQE